MKWVFDFAAALLTFIAAVIDAWEEWKKR